MKYKKTIKFICFSAVFYYLLGSFVQVSFNPVIWSHDAREFTAFVYGLTVFIGLHFVPAMDENDAFYEILNKKKQYSAELDKKIKDLKAGRGGTH